MSDARPSARPRPAETQRNAFCYALPERCLCLSTMESRRSGEQRRARRHAYDHGRASRVALIEVFAENAHSCRPSHPYIEAMRLAIGLWSNASLGSDDTTRKSTTPLSADGSVLSSWSGHDEPTGTKGRSRKDIKAEAGANFDREMSKHEA